MRGQLEQELQTLFFLYFCIHSFNRLKPYYVPGTVDSWRDINGKRDEKSYFHWEVWQNQTRTEQKKKTQQSPTEMGP